ncbi:unnamed protein product [Closterium sp. Yama58-4]|nr:unnamed protein product [Closterium sp. Yama58-4]
MVVPAEGKFLIYPMYLKGPCRSGLQFVVNGDITGAADVSSYPKPAKPSSWALLLFNRISNLEISGGGVMDGAGQGFWKFPGQQRPALLSITNCDGVTIRDMLFTNPARQHVKIYGTTNVLIERVATLSPFNSPNTDSILFSGVVNGIVRNSRLEGGDDNVAIISGCQNILIENTQCINGHGISIGSLGGDGELGCVSDVTVRNVSLRGSNNGLRIKTYQQGVGLVSNVTYEDITVTDVTWPILINQFYCDKKTASASSCQLSSTAVAVTNIRYKNIRGTTNGTVGVLLNCSQSVPCSGISFSNVYLTSSRQPKSPNQLLSTTLKENRVGVNSANSVNSVNGVNSVNSVNGVNGADPDSLELLNQETQVNRVNKGVGPVNGVNRGAAPVNGVNGAGADTIELLNQETQVNGVNKGAVAPVKGVSPLAALFGIGTTSTSSTSSTSANQKDVGASALSDLSGSDLIAVLNNAYGTTDVKTVSVFLAEAQWKGATPPAASQAAISSMAAKCIQPPISLKSGLAASIDAGVHSSNSFIQKQVTRLAGSAHQRLRLSSRLAVPRDAPSAPDGSKDSSDRRSLSVENSQIMQPRDPRQVTAPSPALPPLPPLVSAGLLPLPIALPPPPPWPINEEGVFNVLQFGARADGITDNTDAFRRALQTACAWGDAQSARARVVVPAGGVFQIFPIALEGPCGGGLEVQIFPIELEGRAALAWVDGKRCEWGKGNAWRSPRAGCSTSSPIELEGPCGRVGGSGECGVVWVCEKQCRGVRGGRGAFCRGVFKIFPVELEGPSGGVGGSGGCEE